MDGLMRKLKNRWIDAWIVLMQGFDWTSDDQI
jgi:hypothetical protein